MSGSARSSRPHPRGRHGANEYAWQATGSKFAQKYNTKRPAGLRKWGVHPDMPASKCNIAIVEDDASLRRALERLLRASGFEAHTFASAEEFLGSAVPESHACLILDIRLPGMSGFELFDHLTASAYILDRRSSSPRRTRTACGSKRPGFLIASTCASRFSPPYCWRPSVHCSAAAVPVQRAPEHEARCGASHFSLTRRKSPADEYVCTL